MQEDTIWHFVPSSLEAPTRRRFMQWLTASFGVTVLPGCNESSPVVTVLNPDPPRAIVASLDPLPSIAEPESEGSGLLKKELDELIALQVKRNEAQINEAIYWQEGPILRWNEIARGLVTKYATNPPVASRVYSLLSVAQHDALVAAIALHRKYLQRPALIMDSRLTSFFKAQLDTVYPSDHGAIAGASAAMLSYLYPNKSEVDALSAKAKMHQESRLWAGMNLRSEITSGDQIGREVAKRIIEKAERDNSKRIIPWPGTVPAGKGIWFSSETPAVEPVRPGWGQVRPWFLKSGNQFRPLPPPDVDSPEFKAALDEVRRFSVERTAEQLRIAKFWADGSGTSAPPGHWNEIVADLIRTKSMSQMQIARVMAFMNMAIMDAGIACWDTKYTYWFLRPSHADPTITLPVGLPNFPSYPSGHSTFSSAAAMMVGHFFSDQQERFAQMAEEASMSRVYGGIHYRFDGEIGLAVGRQVAALAIEAEKAGWDKR